MELTQNQITQLRVALLLSLHAAGGHGLAFDMLFQGVKLSGLGTIRIDQVQQQLVFLKDLNQVSESGQPMNVASKIYRLTEGGRIALSDANLIA